MYKVIGKYDMTHYLSHFLNEIRAYLNDAYPNADELYESICSAIDSILVYEKWDLMSCCQEPEDADLNAAVDELFSVANEVIVLDDHKRG